jgi:hypothetical protein
MIVARRLWLLPPIVLFLAVDVSLTLSGQSDSYWAGDHSLAVEGNPLARPFLEAGPGVFVAWAAAWAVLVSLAVLGWRHRISTAIAIFVTFGHAIGGSTWLARSGGWSWLLAIAYIVVAAEFARWCWRRSRTECAHSPSSTK